MWSYYGSKSKIVHLYPKPKYDRIIEPFAGTARYSLLYWDHDITIVDKYEVIVRIWKWLQQCSPNDILSLPKPKLHERFTREMFDCDEQFWLMGFLIGEGKSKPYHLVTWDKAVMTFETDRKNVASQLHKIKRWKIVHGSYEEIENVECTWFVDPPYQYGGEGYVEGNKNLDFQSLAEWCQSRRGQVIVCENHKADWLPFHPMKMINGAANTFTTEVIWSNLPTDYDAEQLSLFNPREYKYEKKNPKPR